MPIYVYRCQECGENFEIRASIKEKEAGLQPDCPKCSSAVTRQMLTTVYSLHIGVGDRAISSCGPNTGPGCCG